MYNDTCWVSWCVADRVGARSQARVAVLWIVGMAHKVAQNYIHTVDMYIDANEMNEIN